MFGKTYLAATAVVVIASASSTVAGPLYTRGNTVSAAIKAVTQPGKAVKELGKVHTHGKETKAWKGLDTASNPTSYAADKLVKHATKKRDLASVVDDFDARDLLDDLDELYSRGSAMGKDYSHAKVTGYAHHKALAPAQRPLPADLHAAVSALGKPHNPAIVAAVVAHASGKFKHGTKKRDLASVADDLLEARDLLDELDELYSRGNVVSSAARVGTQLEKDYAPAKAIGYADDNLKDATTFVQHHLPAHAHAAFSSVNKPHNPAVVAHAHGKFKHGTKKRDLEDVLEELMARELFYDGDELD